MDERADVWFEELYAEVGEDYERIPWVHLAPRPALVHWLDAHPPQPGTNALVVACGLGDDAEELARRGCATSAFDLSSTAIAAARRRFPDSNVDYRVADLFDLPPSWQRAFAIVVEVQTIQSIPIAHHAAAIRAVTDTVAPGGHLLVRAAVRGEHDPAPRRPWPLTPSELETFEREGFRQRARCDDGGFAHIDYQRTG